MKDMYPDIFNENLKGKTVILRADINSSVKDGQLLISPKIIEHAETIRRFEKAKAKTIVLSHQGRPGREDFVSLESHYRALKELVTSKLQFCTWKEDYSKKIASLKEGESLLLENTRFLDFEQNDEISAKDHAKNPVIKKIAEKADYFALDALSVAHRGHATVVGFMPLLPSFAGPVLRTELKALEKINNKESEVTLLLGGMKPEDSIDIMEKLLKNEKAEEVLLGGGMGEMAILAKNKDLGATNKLFEDKKEFIFNI